MDEFTFLAAQSTELGVDAPPVRRLTHTLQDGRTVSALQYGDAATGTFAAPVVTFLHGAGLNAHTWDTTVLALGLPALALDLPGHGDSSWREDAAYVGPALAADIAPAIAAWTDRPQLVVGQSLGGLTAASLAHAHPELVRELVVVDITPGIDPNGDASSIAAFFAGPTDWASRDELVDRALAFGLGGSREAATRGVFLNSRVREDGRVEWKHHFAHLANRLAADPSAAAESQAQQRALRGALSATGWDDLAAAAAPITLVRGERGFVTETDAEEFRRRLPEATIVVVPSGHNVQEELPVPLAALIGDLARD
ncbi:MAG: hydrolase [Microbacterium sp. SCN 70-27]|uniref:alpha/beta fold hydrolase n=1 Tax=unclassified Microbacterium TaxID=2609290 RepID=UPI0008684C2A|nr:MULTISPECIES: alpha/beta hydrolase [unclassified Microbacterium]MBN9224614.1 alpha/beta hydrolase [Microbacterium sp.]ODT28952.1 MAG: hydrolase [Microbacterium sp. SCN 70-27]